MVEKGEIHSKFLLKSEKRNLFSSAISCRNDNHQLK